MDPGWLRRRYQAVSSAPTGHDSGQGTDGVDHRPQPATEASRRCSTTQPAHGPSNAPPATRGGPIPPTPAPAEQGRDDNAYSTYQRRRPPHPPAPNTRPRRGPCTHRRAEHLMGLKSTPASGRVGPVIADIAPPTRTPVGERWGWRFQVTTTDAHPRRTVPYRPTVETRPPSPGRDKTLQGPHCAGSAHQLRNDHTRRWSTTDPHRRQTYAL